MVRVAHHERGTTTCLAGEMIGPDESKLGKLKGLDGIPTWIAKTQKAYGLAWEFDKPKISGAPAPWKPKIAAWLKTLAV
jgi:hypothetical protein